MESKFIPMLQQAGEYKDIICSEMRYLLGFLPEQAYIVLGNLLTGNHHTSTQQVTQELVEMGIPEIYVGVASKDLYQQDVKFKVLVDSLCKCDQIRSQIIPQMTLNTE